MKTITIEIPDGKRTEWVNGVLTLIDEAPKDVTERIKTVEDAVNELGEEHPLVKEWKACGLGLSDNLKAFLQLRIIAAALNEGWKPQFVEDEYRWYPWFCLYTQGEIDNMNEDEKKELVRFGGNAPAGSQSGLGFSSSYCAFSSSDAAYGSRLAVKSKELSEYFGRQFIHIWGKFLIG